MGTKLINEIGNRYGRLIVSKRVANNADGSAMWLCRCDCGNEVIARGCNLRYGNYLSCGCLQSEHRRRLGKRTGGQPGFKHGMSRTPIYHSWANMIQRCIRFANRDYHNYGGRGVRVCPRWRYSFENFYADMGDMPEGLTLDRIDNNRHYEPGNCRWATRKEQAKNRRNGKGKTTGGYKWTKAE